MSITPRPTRAAIAQTAAVLAAAWWTCGLSAQDGFTFAGLGRRTTVEEVRKRYPTSSLSGTHVYVSERDSHDHIYSIDIPTDGGNRSLRVYFERQGSPSPSYPPCEQVLGVLKTQYSDPATVQEFDEERARNRRFIWRRADEELALLCFRLGGQPFLASELTIAAAP